MCADFEATSAKARRRKSLAQAMKLVDSAIANLEGVSGSTDEIDAPMSASSRRRRSTVGSEEDGGKIGAGRRKSVAMRRAAMGAMSEEDSEALRKGMSLLRSLVQQCADSSTSTASVSASEIAVLRLALTDRAGSASRNLSGGVLPKPANQSSFNASALAASVLPTPPEVPNLRSWDFDIFAVNRALGTSDSGGGTEVTVKVGCALFVDAGLVEYFGLDPCKLVAFLHGVEGTYVKAQPYHNHLHGIDVCQTVHFFLHTAGLGSVLAPWERLGTLLAALCHDMGHWGLNNSWLNATHDPLALQYSYTSPLENMHCAKAMGLLATPGCDILSGLAAGVLSSAQAMKVRSLMVKLILATDMANHAPDLAELKSSLGTKQQGSDTAWLQGDENAKSREIVLKTALHAADVSNPAKPWAYYMQWTDRVLQEFFHQGDLERERGLPIGMGFDRTKVTTEVDKAKGQLGFIGFVVAPLYQAFGQVNAIDLDATALQCLAENEAAWKEVVSKG